MFFLGISGRALGSRLFISGFLYYVFGGFLGLGFFLFLYCLFCSLLFCLEVWSLGTFYYLFIEDRG